MRGAGLRPALAAGGVSRLSEPPPPPGSSRTGTAGAGASAASERQAPEPIKEAGDEGAAAVPAATTAAAGTTTAAAPAERELTDEEVARRVKGLANKLLKVGWGQELLPGLFHDVMRWSALHGSSAGYCTLVHCLLLLHATVRL